MSGHYPSALAYLLASRQREIASLRSLLQSGRLTTEVSQLIHEIQRERGASNLWICSAGQLFSDELLHCGCRVTRSQKAVMALLPALPQDGQDGPASSRLYSRIATALQALGELNTLRQQVRALQLTHAVAMEQFNHIIRQLLNLVFEMVDTASDPGVSRVLIAMFSFMQGKELAGQERAIGAAGFACGHFTPTISQQIVALIDAQERCFSHFAGFADEESLQRWQQVVQSENKIERLRRIACTAAPTDEQGAAMALRWHQSLTQRIDGLKTVEDCLAHALMQRCRQSIAAAEAQRDIPPGDLQQQMQKSASEPAWSVFVAGNDGRAPVLSGTLEPDGLTPQLGRSLLALIQQQSQRLQDQDDELAAMRSSIEDRKQIDRAKVLLMQHHGYSEEQAWQALRKMAMNQNKRMADIASALLAVASAFVSQGN
ncbi:nitrate- and nitrite sensing domain-containing protein [Pantoea agglomerans]|uniref:Nitrate- and nitrite sensing domain-containing protein n=1 Tax=Enterobacter agglomerans TaxID=549 RepID=A0ACC5RQD7_ENTAG|nr:nitrate- and nitrite sensing domain-containing protein [Pantoea agglomerans]MBK4726675.1 nitrate- and nitrite sensing domain-containing protein [Pantoea agglomerans]